MIKKNRVNSHLCSLDVI